MDAMQKEVKMTKIGVNEVAKIRKALRGKSCSLQISISVHVENSKAPF